MYSKTTILAALGLAATTQAHVFINTPKPFANTISSPLADNGANFPCQRAVSFGEGGATTMALGSTQPISFTGSAVHGGGSCQISITYDLAPTKDSVWKVIHSIHGGCPMRDIDQNNGNDATLVSPSKYSFTVPSDLPAGDAILAWTWFNKIGNREMYMNCAPVTFTGGNTRRDEDVLETRNTNELVQRDQSFYNALPDMFKANIGNCVTVEGINLLFPNPGTSVEFNPDVRPHALPPAACGTAANSPAPVPSQPAPAPSSSAAAPSQAPSAAPVKPSLPGGVFITVDPTRGAATSTTSSPVQAPTTSPAAPEVSSPVEAPASSQTTVQTTTFIVVPTKSNVVNPPAQTGNSGVQSGPCTEEGRWNCINGTSFQQCASGSWSQAQPLAAGTRCTAGQSAVIDIQAIGLKKRVSRINKKHLHRHQARS